MIANASFELPAGALQQGAPSDWVVTTVGTGEDMAAFAGDSAAMPAGTESFEHGWGPQDPQSVLYGSAMAVQSRDVETMTEWVVLSGAIPLNQYVLFLAVTEAATFSSHTTSTELFTLWVTGGDTDQVFVDSELEHANFEGSVSFESFDWDSFASSLGSVEHNLFGASQLAETFGIRLKQDVIVDLDLNRLVRRDGHSFEGGAGEVFTITTTDTLPSPFRDTRTYYVVDSSGPYVGLSEASGGEYVTIADAGVGTHYLRGDPARFWVDV